MEFLIKAAQLILSLSILVVLHELGHFLPARWFKTRVEKFYLFFDPWFSLWKKKVGDTEYGIGWIPLGGYVKISGMVDESMDTDQLKKPPQPWEFRSKPAWQRLIIMVGGVTVNLILGMVLYIMILFVWGRDYLPLEEVRFGVHPSETMLEEGFREGDHILAVGERTPRTLEEVGKAILIDRERVITVERAGERVRVQLTQDVEQRIMERNERTLFKPRLPFVVDTVMPDGAAAASGIAKGDVVLAVDRVDARYFGDFRKAMQERKGKDAVVLVKRNDEELSFTMKVNEDGLVGLGNMAPSTWFTMAHEDFGFLASIPAGIRFGTETLGNYVSGMKLIFSRSGAKQVGGFGTLGSLFSPTWDWQVFWGMTAFLSIVLAFMNILPIPALDGGHVVFLLYEIVTGRTPNQRVLEVAQMIGIFLLLGLLLYANGNDLFKLLTGKF
ncbi:MAG: RIP metalloprotease RseP [Flavobacteriales bacterium]|nr:RIP metalloprotease RseP [Flavobacteriales bacterium]